jgi:hypothetical protein
LLKVVEEVLPQCYPAPEFYWRNVEPPLADLVSPPTAPDPGDYRLLDHVLLGEVSRFFPAPEEQAPVDPNVFLYALARLHWFWPPGSEGGETLLGYPDIIHAAWIALRDLACRLDVAPAGPEPTNVQDPRSCRAALDQVIAWCWDQEKRSAAQEPPPQLTGSQEGQDLGAAATPPAASKKKKEWTQQEVDKAIKQLRAGMGATYYDLVENVRRGLPGAEKEAKKLYGRNALARRLGLRSRALVSKSPVWQDIAKELKLRHKGEETKRIGGRRRMGYEMAVGEKAEEVGDTTSSRVIRKETVSLIRNNLPADQAAEIISKLETGQISDERARAIVRFTIEQRKDDTYKVYQSP